MLETAEIYLDTFCEVYDLLKPWATGDFWNFATVDPQPGAVYLIGREQFNQHVDRIRKIAERNDCVMVLSNPHEGSETLRNHCDRMGVLDLVEQGKLLLISGGDMEAGLHYLQFDSFLPKILDYEENVFAANQYQQCYTTTRPYKFLFLNGRSRPHRVFLLNRLQHLLPDALWTNLDSHAGAIQTLPQQYEFDFYQFRVASAGTQGFVKHQLFNNDWGEIYLKAAPYADTYFSVVTETVFDYPHSFRTEKIWKPVAMGHPWIAVANAGYYRDLRNLGFRTFDSAIDESFDSIENNQDRLERIAQVIDDLCSQDLESFLKECYNTCKYNQQHLAEMRVSVRKEFPDRFHQFIQQHLHD
jgi:hypothetical protein